jgi:hypothetical protein
MQTVRHPPVTFSKSLPSHAHNKPDHITANGHKSTKTAGKQKLSRSGEDSFIRQEDKLRRKATIWRNDLAAAKRRKEDLNVNLQR